MQTSFLMMQATTTVASPVTAVQYALGPPEIFTLLFIMLGPLKLLGPYAHSTSMLPRAQVRVLALKTTLLASVAVIGGGFIGAALLVQWNVDTSILELTTGLVLFLVALRMVMQPYAATPPSEVASVEPPTPMKILFPLMLTPYGIALVILLLALSADPERTILILGIVVANMLLNLLGMLSAHWIMRKAALPLMVLGAILGILQAALGLQIVYKALSGLDIV